MIDIKSKLKEYEITLSDFARKLEISRPTLDAYISTYEKGNKIAKEKYQTIFDSLFSRDISCKEDFIKVLEYSEELIDKDRILGTEELDVKKTDILDSVIAEMKNDMKSSDCDEDIYIFINMIIRSYKKECTFKKLAEYFMILNGRKSLEAIQEKDKVYLSNYYKLFYKDKKNLLKLDDLYLNKFLKRVKELEDSQRRYQELIEKELVKKVQEKIKEKINLGIDMKDLDIYELIGEINLKK